MKLNEAKKKAVAAFTKNPYWQGVYDRAPEDAKEYLALLFLSSAPEFAVDDEADGKLVDALAETEAHLVQESKDYILSVFDKGAAHDIMTRRFRAVAASQTPEVGLPVLNPDFSERETKKPDIAGLSFTWMNNKGIDTSKKKSNSIFGLNGASAVATDAADGQQDDGAKHITEEEVFAALEEFIGKPTADESGNVTWEGGNEYWRDLFMEAPDGARLRLQMTFYFSENHEKPDFPLLEYRAMRKAIEDALDFDSLEYLIANEDNEAAKNHYKDIWKAKMEKEGGQGDDGNDDGDADNGGGDNGGGDDSTAQDDGNAGGDDDSGGDDNTASDDNDGGDNSDAQNDGDDDADGNSDANQDGDDDNQEGDDADGDNSDGDGDGDGGVDDEGEDEDVGNPDDDPALQQSEDDEDTDENGNAVEMNDDGTFVLASDPDTVAVFNDGERRYSLVEGERKYVDGDNADNAQNADGEGDNKDSSNGDEGDNADNGGGSDGGGEGDNADNGGDDEGDDGDEPVLDEEGRECIAIGKGTLVLKDDNEKVAVFKDESGRFSIIDGEPKPIEDGDGDK